MPAAAGFPSTSERLLRRAAKLAGLAVALGALVAMAAWSWGRLVEIQIDFGREMYLAWQLAAGKRLYADLVYYYGPISPYFNALILRIFGTSIHSILLSNLAIAALIMAVMYRLLRDVGTPFSATTACLVFATVFACASYFPHPSIFNYVAPYTHPATHGLLFALISLSLASRAIRAPTPAAAALCGVFTGLTFLTKPELFVSASGAMGVGFGFTCWQHRRARRQMVGLLSCWLTGGLAAVLAAFLALWLRMPARTALAGILGSWPYMQNQKATLYNHWVMGLDDFRGNALTLLRVLPGYGMLLLPLSYYVPGRKSKVAVLTVGLGSALAIFAAGRPALVDALRPLPVFLGAMAFGLAFWWFRGRNTAEAPAIARKLMLALFAGLLLGRICLQVTAGRYGFVLAAPAALLLVVALLVWIPDWLGAPSGRPLYTAGVLGLMALFAVDSLSYFRAAQAQRRYPVGSGGDLVLADAHCAIAADALEEIRHRLRPGETLCVLPEGIMVNYLARIPSPVPYDCFIPPSLEMFDEGRIIASFEAHPPDYVLFLPRSTSEYGARLFGRDYGRSLYSWLIERYHAVAERGGSPLTGEGEGFILMAAKAPTGQETRLVAASTEP
jgi:hypothetical protein